MPTVHGVGRSSGIKYPEMTVTSRLYNSSGVLQSTQTITTDGNGNWTATIAAVQAPSVASQINLCGPSLHILSSSIDVDRSLRGAERIIAIGKALGGRTYVNAPGGRALYGAAAFRGEGMELKFLAPYEGAPGSALPALMGDVAALRVGVRRSTAIEER